MHRHLRHENKKKTESQPSKYIAYIHWAGSFFFICTLRQNRQNCSRHRGLEHDEGGNKNENHSSTHPSIHPSFTLFNPIIVASSTLPTHKYQSTTIILIEKGIMKMARFSNTVLLFSLLLVQLSHHLVQAGYTFQAPTAATRWVAGQTGLVTIVSNDKADDETKATDRLLTITLRNDRNTAAVIKDGLQLLIPVDSDAAQVSWTWEWLVPADMPAGAIYR